MEWNVNLDSKSSMMCRLPFRSWPPGCCVWVQPGTGWLLLESSVVGDLAGGAGGGFSFAPLVPGPRPGLFFCRNGCDPGGAGGAGKACALGFSGGAWKLGDLGGSGGGASLLLLAPGIGGAGNKDLGVQEA